MILGMPEKIMILDTWIGNHGKSVDARIACDCTDSRCDIRMDMNYDIEDKMLSLNFYRKFKWDIYTHSKDDTLLERFNNYMRRLKARFVVAVKMLFTGYIEMDGETILVGKQIDTLIQLLQESKDFCLNENTESKNESDIIERLKEDFEKSVIVLKD